ncbi:MULTISPECIES: SMODS domain-containing nucleotidyltransferase [Cytobacillus]|uniref:Nucleotidyltransferase n=1 Tax=Cytobacillus firmus TaxID=1399 RepID=A0AA46SG60_CYTFI|nr:MULTISPECIES: nucleotidyltransferase [Cytobacillus]MDF2039361.1 nucleotidyltransferase [Cytobacillus oceanisediminis]UYG96741.1 nucleotidyltransferase [Cytobacillus firmus]
MSVNNYLSSLASKLVLSSIENSNIKTSISTLSRRLDYYFDAGELHKHFQFGSSTRGTILPRKVDYESDIDYMVVFKNPKGYTPDTLLRYLKDFMHSYYNRSEIYKDSPTMVLELNHIKFELVPAIQDSGGNLSIPSKRNILTNWMATDPLGFNERITRVNVYNNSKIKPLIRLMKYWNTNKLGGYFYSFELEDWLVQRFDYNSKASLKDYVYESFDGLIPSFDDSQRYKDSLARTKEIIQEVKWYDSNGYPITAKEKIQKVFPDI